MIWNPFRNLKRKSISEIIVHLLASLIFMAVALSYIYILVWAVLSALKTHNDVVMKPFALPTEWHWEHFIEVFQTLESNGTGFLQMFFNSVFFSVVTTLLTQLVTMTMAYCCSKYKFPGSNLIYMIVLIVITLPIYGTGGANYKLHYSLGTVNSYAFAFVVGGFNICFLYYYAYFKNLSWTYAEAAMMDGANHFQIYYKVMFPQATPILGALFLTNWITRWNAYEEALVYYPEIPTLPAGIYELSEVMVYRSQLHILFAACVITTIPALILFIAFNKVITTNVSVGGIKG